MTTHKTFGAVLWFALIASLLFTACRDCEPMPSTQQAVYIQFYSFDSLVVPKKPKIFVIDRDFKKVTSPGATDTLAHNAADGRLELFLPFQSDTVLYAFTGLKNEADTLRLAFSRKIIPVPPDCGAYIEYSNLSIVSHTFDSAIVKFTKVSYQQTPHIQIFD